MNIRRDHSRRAFLKTVGIAAGACLLAGDAQAVLRPKHALRKPNFVMFLVDDMGWMDSSVYGSRYYETPNLERFAKMSVRFTDAYSGGPVCTATRASIMTGKYPGRLGITGAGGGYPEKDLPPAPLPAPPDQQVLIPLQGVHLNLEEYTLAEALRDAGYRTGHVGKWHLGAEPKYWPETQGFDVNIGGGPWAGPPSYFAPYKIANLPDGPEGEYIADALTDHALRFIEESKDKPFYLNFWQYAVHAPFQAKEEYRQHFAAKLDPRGAQDNAIMAAMLKSMDDSFGRVLDKLEQLGLMDNTVILFSSDNGGCMYDHIGPDGQSVPGVSQEGRRPTNNTPLRSGKASPYEGGIRVPTLCYWPGVVRGGSVSREVINSIDYYPTFLAMAGIAPKPGVFFDGISIVPALKAKRLRREAVYGHYPHMPLQVPCQPSSWVRKGDWKLIRFYNLDESFPNRFELYNLREDLSELHNLAEKEPARVRELNRMLQKHLEETGAKIPPPNPDYRPKSADAR